VALAPEARGPALESARSPRALHPERWSEIVDAAGEEFDEKGYASARIEDIAARVGLLKGSLYYYIDSKEDLLFAIVDGDHNRGIAVIEESAALGTADPPARLGAFIARWTGILSANRGYSAISERDLRRLSPERQAIVMEKRGRIHRFAREIIERGIAEGYFAADVDPGVTTNSLFEMLNGVSQWFHPSRPLSYEELAEHLWRFVLRGLGADPAAYGPALP
jgi:TetR/AcrR family transcriptional regulator, cholesterol catabolism regulator